MSAERDEREEDYILVANPARSYEDDPMATESLDGQNSFTAIYDSKIQPLSGGMGNYIMEVEDYWPNTDDVLAVNPDTLRNFIPEGHVAKVSRNIPIWMKYDGGELNTVMDFPEEFHEDPMEYDIILGSKPSPGPSAGTTQHEERSELKGEDVRVTNIKSGEKPVIQGHAPIQQVANQLDPEDPKVRELREMLEKDPENL